MFGFYHSQSFTNVPISVYIGPFTQTYRDRLWSSWIDICLKKQISVSKKDYISLLSAPIEVQEYFTQGLPRDHFSTENAVLLRNCHRWPLLIDPQGQGKCWLLGLEKENLAVIPYGSVHMLTDIENAIRLGTSVLLEVFQLSVLSRPLLLLIFSSIVLPVPREVPSSNNHSLFRVYRTT